MELYPLDAATGEFADNSMSPPPPRGFRPRSWHENMRRSLSYAWRESFIAFFLGRDAAREFAREAINSKAEHIFRDQRLRRIPFIRLKRYLQTESGYSGHEIDGHEHGLFAASSKLELVRFAVQEGIDLEPVLRESHAPSTPSSIGNRSAPRSHSTLAYTHTPVKARANKVRYGGNVAAFSAEMGVGAIAGASSRTASTCFGVSASAAPLCAPANPHLSTTSAHSSESDKDVAAAAIQLAAAQYIREVKTKEGTSSSGHAATRGANQGRGSLKPSSSSTRVISLTISPMAVGVESRSVRVRLIRREVFEARQPGKSAVFPTHAATSTDAHPAVSGTGAIAAATSPAPADGVSKTESELQHKVKMIRQQLQIPDEAAVPVEKLADMVPIQGSLEEKIDALYAKLSVSA